MGSVDGVDALAALGASDWFNWVYLGIIQGLAQGFTIPMTIGRFWLFYAMLRFVGAFVVLLGHRKEHLDRGFGVGIRVPKIAKGIDKTRLALCEQTANGSQSAEPLVVGKPSIRHSSRGYGVATS